MVGWLLSTPEILIISNFNTIEKNEKQDSEGPFQKLLSWFLRKEVYKKRFIAFVPQLVRSRIRDESRGESDVVLEVSDHRLVLDRLGRERHVQGGVSGRRPVINRVRFRVEDGRPAFDPLTVVRYLRPDHDDVG